MTMPKGTAETMIARCVGAGAGALFRARSSDVDYLANGGYEPEYGAGAAGLAAPADNRRGRSFGSRETAGNRWRITGASRRLTQVATDDTT